MSFKSKLTENHNTTEDVKKYNVSVPNIPYTEHKRKTTIPNYVPHRTPRNTNGERWQNSYNKYLTEMFYICQNIIDNELPKHKITYGNKEFNIFSRMIYDASSKYISPYLDNSY